MADRRNWANNVGRVFDTRPRVASGTTVWLERKSAYESLASAMERPGSHVCLDGPTGVGKTSLMHTYIANEKIKHSSIMLTQSMTWVDFCRRLVGIRDNTETSMSGDLEAGLQNGLPSAKFKVSLGAKSKPADSVDLSEKMANSWTEHDVAKILAQNDLVLVIDDAERCSEDLMRRISDLCKLLTQEYISLNSKIAIIGSGNVYVRLHRANPALDERISQVSLGAFKSPNDSRLFIARGLEKLRLRHPWNSKIPREFEMRDKCRDAIWEAANGLPKSLNRLGYEIANRGRERSGISATDILVRAQTMIEEHWVQYSQEFPEVLDLLETDQIAAEIIKSMYSSGITRIHNTNKLISNIFKSNPSLSDTQTDSIEKSLSLLVAAGFIVQTGKSGELIFVKHPAAAHTLGVVMRDPAKVKHIPIPKRPNGMPNQLKIVFSSPEYPATTDYDTPSDDA